MVRILSLTLAISILVLIALPTGLPARAHADSPVVPLVRVFSPDYGSSNITDPGLTIGSEFTIDLDVNNAPTFNAYEIALFYDPSFLQATSTDLTTSTMFPNPYSAIDYISPSGGVFLSVVNLGAVNGGSGTLAHVTFKVLAIGVSPLALAAGAGNPTNARVAETCQGCPTGSPDWTRLLAGSLHIDVNKSDGYFRNSSNKLGPVASFSITPSSPQEGSTVTLNATASYDPDNSSPSSIRQYEWDFGDGSTANSTIPLINHVYAANSGVGFPLYGNFSTRLTVVDSDDGFEGMITHSVEVIPVPPICPHGLSIINVPKDCPTIQSAIDSAVKGGTIQVSPGTYEENPIVQKPVTLIGSGTDLTIVEGGFEIYSPNVTLTGFRILSGQSVYGIYFGSAGGVLENNLIIGESTTPNGVGYTQGITVSNSPGVLMTGNIIEDETSGVSIQNSPGATLRNNQMFNNSFSFGVSGSYSQDIDSSNMIDGKPIFYGTDVSTSEIPTDPGYIGIVNSHDVRVGPILVSNVDQGILIVNSSRVTVNRLTAIGVRTGASIFHSASILLENSTVQPSSSCTGAELISTVESSISNNTFSFCSTGISLSNSSGDTIANNFVQSSSFSFGIDAYNSTMNLFINNRLASSGYSYAGGFSLDNSPANQLVDNEISGGLTIYDSPMNTLRGNQIQSNNSPNIEIDSNYIQCLFASVPCKHLIDYIQNIDSSNTVNGKPIYYLVNSRNIAVPSNAGFVAVVNSTNISVKDVSLSYNVQDVLIASSKNITISDSNLTNAFEAVSVWASENTTIANNFMSNINFQAVIDIRDSEGGRVIGNTIVDSESYVEIDFFNSTGFRIEGNYLSTTLEYGIRLQGSRNMIDRNTIIDTFKDTFPFLQIGISILSSSSENLVVGNTISLFYRGLEAGDDNTIYMNNFLDNNIQAEGGTADTWNDATGQGNYWSDYTGQDTDNDGIGDTLLPHLGLDNYPLMSPWTPTSLSAKLTGRSAWPEYRRLAISKVTGGIQMLYALANNTGTAPEWIETVFNVTSSTGVTNELVSGPIWVNAGAQVRLSTSFFSLPGSYKVTATLRFSSDAYTSWTLGSVKTFSFQVVS